MLMYVYACACVPGVDYGSSLLYDKKYVTKWHVEENEVGFLAFFPLEHSKDEKSENSYYRASAPDFIFAKVENVNTSDQRVHIKSQEQIHAEWGTAWDDTGSIMSTEVQNISKWLIETNVPNK